MERSKWGAAPRSIDSYYQAKIELLRRCSLPEILSQGNPCALVLSGDQPASPIVSSLLKAYVTEHDEVVPLDLCLGLVRSQRETTSLEIEYDLAFAASVNRFTAEFVNDFCFPDGNIDWEKLVRFVSEDKPKKK